ncbi:transcriptional regulator, partial [Escherichia coli]|nr:transcriptional regulator [Escherichia coli]
MAKISAVLPDNLKDSLDSTALRVGPRVIQDAEVLDLGIVRAAIRLQRKLRITYIDGAGQESERVIWPFSLGYFQ